MSGKLVRIFVPGITPGLTARGHDSLPRLEGELRAIHKKEPIHPHDVIAVDRGTEAYEAMHFADERLLPHERAHTECPETIVRLSIGRRESIRWRSHASFQIAEVDLSHHDDEYRPTERSGAAGEHDHEAHGHAHHHGPGGGHLAHAPASDASSSASHSGHGDSPEARPGAGDCHGSTGDHDRERADPAAAGSDAGSGGRRRPPGNPFAWSPPYPADAAREVESGPARPDARDHLYKVSFRIGERLLDPDFYCEA